MPQGDSKQLTMNFSAPNGYWNEVLHLGRVSGIWHQCLSIMGPTIKQAMHPFIYCDSDWPEGKRVAEKDWVFTLPKMWVPEILAREFRKFWHVLLQPARPPLSSGDGCAPRAHRGG